MDGIWEIATAVRSRKSVVAVKKPQRLADSNGIKLHIARIVATTFTSRNSALRIRGNLARCIKKVKPPCLRRLFVHNEGRGVENLVTSGLPHPTLWFFYARTGDPAMPGGQRIQYPQGESSRLTSYSFRTPRHPINRDSSKKLTRSQS
nr:MAG TPA: hypothetical protein [Caudoviricetes sp.]